MCASESCALFFSRNGMEEDTAVGPIVAAIYTIIIDSRGQLSNPGGKNTLKTAIIKGVSRDCYWFTFIKQLYVRLFVLRLMLSILALINLTPTSDLNINGYIIKIVINFK